MRLSEMFTCFFGIAFFVALIAGIYGWVENIVTLVGSSGDPITGMFLLRCVGIFVAPLGAILGFF